MRRHSRGPAAAIAGGLAAAAMGLIVYTAGPSRAVEHCGPEPGRDADARVILKDSQFTPSAVNLPTKGMIVCWEHQDGMTGHSITLDPPSMPATDYPGDKCVPGDPDNCFQQGDQPYAISFDSPGVFNYHCKIHAAMKGTVTVGGAVATTSTTKAGVTTTTKATNTTVGSLTTSTTAEETTTSSTSAISTTSSSIDFTTQTTIGGTAAGDTSDDDNPSGVLEAVGVLLLAAVVAALIPAWRRLT